MVDYKGNSLVESVRDAPERCLHPRSEEKAFPALSVPCISLQLHAGVENTVLSPGPGREVLPMGAMGVTTTVGRAEATSLFIWCPHAPPFLSPKVQLSMPGALGKTLPDPSGR